MKKLMITENWFAGLQWFFFIFTNIIVIPISIGAAYELSADKITSIVQMSFIITGLACIIQALWGHHRAILEGQSGLWWGVYLTLVITAADQGLTLGEVGGSLAVGAIISGVLTWLIGILNLGPLFGRLFNSAVMGVFVFLLGVQLIGIFLKGMLGIPFGNEAQHAQIDLHISGLSIFIVILVIIINIKGPLYLKKYGLLIGIVVGWLLFVIFFNSSSIEAVNTSFQFILFPLGAPNWNNGIILVAILAGLLNLANTYGALKGTDPIYQMKTTKKQYRNSLSVTGLITIIAAAFGLVPHTPYVASVGFLIQSRIIDRLPFILGGFMFLMLGFIPPIGTFFTHLPLSVGSAVLFVAYLLFFHSAWGFLKQVNYNTNNVYRTAIPIFVGIIIMTMPISYFESLPSLIRPFLSSGLLVGILLAVLLENFIQWDKIGDNRTLKSK